MPAKVLTTGNFSTEAAHLQYSVKKELNECIILGTHLFLSFRSRLRLWASGCIFGASDLSGLAIAYFEFCFDIRYREG